MHFPKLLNCICALLKEISPLIRRLIDSDTKLEMYDQDPAQLTALTHAELGAECKTPVHFSAQTLYTKLYRDYTNKHTYLHCLWCDAGSTHHQHLPSQREGTRIVSFVLWQRTIIAHQTIHTVRTYVCAHAHTHRPHTCVYIHTHTHTHTLPTPSQGWRELVSHASPYLRVAIIAQSAKVGAGMRG